jgi:hypothetical protein
MGIDFESYTTDSDLTTPILLQHLHLLGGHRSVFPLPYMFFFGIWERRSHAILVPENAL